jgi:hypothetical protein
MLAFAALVVTLPPASAAGIMIQTGPIQIGGPLRLAALTAGVPTPGIYDVAVTVSTPAHARGRVQLLIGSLWRRATAGSDGRRTRVSVTLPVSGHTITVRARSRNFKPRLALTAQLVGSTGASGAAGSIVSAGTPAAAPVSASTPAAPTPPPAPSGPQFPGSPFATSPSSGPIGDPGSWRLVFDDEFNGSGLNTRYWTTGWFGSSGISAPVNSEELECYDPSHVVVANGELDLNLTQKTESCSGTRPYASGMVTTNGKFTYTYGYLEARVWLPGSGAIADWPAVWTDGQNWPTDGELDVLEGLGGDACWHFHDPAGGPGACETAPFTGAWHTFGADWEPGTVTYYYDGIPVGTLTSGITAAPMYIILNLAADNTYGGPQQAPATMRVDYVRVWQH